MHEEDKSKLDWRRMLENQLHSEDEASDQDFQHTDQNELSATENSACDSSDNDLALQLDDGVSGAQPNNIIFTPPSQPNNNAFGTSAVVLDDLSSMDLGKRDRNGVNYLALNQHLFGKLSDTNYESDENDDDYRP
eukprot:TRINITY_DN3957_c0_g1_i16.p3 TRINITY_DN3957_c0_g1~~TRINITY_DN3957_c0_g1_i16.p3  ORF type:complete len:135 (-),score=34.50 TRINITY_DN3957_c0_g1_i16:332-736(-)